MGIPLLYDPTALAALGNSINVFLGPNRQVGDKRYVIASTTTGNTFQSYFGWQKVYDQVISGVARVGVFTRVIEAGDGSTLPITLGTSTTFAHVAFTAKGWNTAQVLAPAHQGSSTASNNVTAPSVATGLGVLVTYHAKQQNSNASSGLNGWTAPPGMTLLIDRSYSGGSTGPVVGSFWEPRSSGASGTRTAVSINTNLGGPVESQAGPWRAVSLFIQGIPDTVVTLGRVIETNTVRPVTFEYGPVTVGLGRITESNTVRPVTNPLEAHWTSRPLVLSEEFPITGSLLTWDAVVPGGSSLEMETSVDNGASWQDAQNGAPVPKLIAGTAAAPTVLVRAIMRRSLLTSPSPTLRRIELRVPLDASRDEYIPLGVFTINDSDIFDSADGVSIEISGNDLSRKISRNRWERTYVIYEGTPVHEAIRRIIRNRLPGTQFNFVNTTEVIPRSFFGLQANNDPWEDALKIAAASGLELYFDPLGVCCLRYEPDPNIDSPVWEFEDRIHPTIISVRRRVTDENTYNRIVVVGEGSGLEAPVRGIAEDLDPASATYLYGEYGINTEEIRSSYITTTAQAMQAARARLLRMRGATEALELEVIPMPALEPGDIHLADRSRSKIKGQFVIDAIRMPLGAHELMRVASRRQRLG